jgi:hypothetical protein
LNISNIVNDSKFILGYCERYPIDLNQNNILFKNSFLGYISEFNYLQNQAYFRKFDNFIEKNLFDVRTKLNKLPSEMIIFDPSNNNKYQDINIINNNKIPFEMSITN